MAKSKKKKPSSKWKKAKAILEVLAYIATIVSAVYQMLKG